MPIERSSVIEASQIAPEDLGAPGVAVDATRRLQALGFKLKPNIEVERFRPYGFKYDTLTIPGKDWTTIDIMGRLDYNNIVYPLASVVNSPELVALGADTDEKQQVAITGTPAGGNFTLTFDGLTTANIVYNATAANVVSALEALPNIGVGGVTATGGPLPGTPVVVTFVNNLGGRSIPQMTASSAGLTGGTSPTVAVTTTVPGVVSNGTEWTFISQSTAPDVPQTYTIDSGSVVRAQRATNVVLQELTIGFQRSSIELGGSGIGQLFQDNVKITGNAVYTVTVAGTVSGGTFTLTHNAVATSPIPYNASAETVRTALFALPSISPSDVVVTGGPGATNPYVVSFTGNLGNQPVVLTANFASLTAAPGASAIVTTKAGVRITDIPAVPVVPGRVNIYLDDTAANFGVTQLDRVFQADLAISNRYNPMWVLNSNNPSWVAIVETAPDVTLKLKQAADGVGMANLTRIRSGATAYIRLDSDGGPLPSPDQAANYLFRVDLACKVESPDDLDDHEGATAVDWTFRGVHDPDFGKVMRVFVRNSVAAL